MRGDYSGPHWALSLRSLFLVILLVHFTSSLIDHVMFLSLGSQVPLPAF